MASQAKHKQLNSDTFIVDIQISFLTVVGVSGLLLYYSSTTITLTDVPIPYKPTKSGDQILLTLHTSISQLHHISSLLRTLISKSKDPLILDPLITCDDLLNYAVSQLNDSANLLTKGPGDDDQVFTETLDNWITFAILDQEMCLSYLEKKTRSQVVDEQVGLRLQRFKQCTKNNVAVLEKIHPLLKKYRTRVCLNDYICATM